MKNKLIPILLLTIITASCTRYKNLVYLQEEKQADKEIIFTAVPPDYHIQNRDVLFIRIISLNQDITQVINITSNVGSNQYTNDASLFIYGYNVSDSGFVEIPVIGKAFVVDKTLEEAKIEISKQAAKFIKDATVIVKLISFKYSVMGEVNKPGVYQNYNNQLTVLEAISNAGDISPYGNRRKVMVIRPGTNGTQTFRLDLTKTDILNSPGFFLLPNDIVYIEPVKSYNFRVNIPTVSLLLTGISTLILVLNYVDTN
ncbi:MAG: polysaccharide biosynthesis/export family protein [Bacteroidales bacterium]|nr:polysaccharide biosynthesis/export family protein [Bacteroidales bacterium]